MKIDPYYQQQKCRPMTLVSGGIRFIRIFAEIPWGGPSNDSVVLDNGNFQRFRWLFLGPPGRAVMFCCCFFVFFLQREISAVSRPIAANFATRSKIWGPPLEKNWDRKAYFLARFRTTSHFDREYLRNGTSYRQSENGVANYDLSRVCGLRL